MTETLSIRLPESLARQVKSKARAAGTNVSDVARELFTEYVRQHKAPPTANGMQQHIDAYAGTWDAHCSAEELLRRTRR